MRRRRSAPAASAALCALAVVLACTPEPAPAPLLLITVDTLRADRLGAWGSDRDLTPHLDALARESLVFTRTYAPASFTVPSVAALMTGRYPQTLGIWKNESGLPEGTATLASVLRERGWRTAAVVSNFVLREASGLDHGFDLYDDDLPEHEAVRGWPERSATATTDAALSALDACAAGHPQCFLWVHYQDPHGPYTPPEALRQRALARERAAPDGGRVLPVEGEGPGPALPAYQVLGERRDVAWYRAGYDGEVAHTDAEIGRLLAGLDERGLADAALVVFASDHGESLGEDDYWFAHGAGLSDVLVRVPLLLRGPGIRAGRRRDPASLVDLLPTLERLLTGTVSERGGAGRDLLAPGAAGASSHPLLATLGAGREPLYGLVEGDYKLLVAETAGGPRVTLLRGEPERLVPDRDDLRDALVRRLAKRREALPVAPAVRVPLTDDDRRKLRALGYAVE